MIVRERKNPSADTAVASRLALNPEKDEGFCRLFLNNWSAIYSFFRHRGLTPEDCRDLTQETFLRVYKNIGQLRSEEKFRVWLFQIAGNLLHNEARYRSALKRDAKVVQFVEIPDPDQPVSADVLLAAAAKDDDPLTDLMGKERVRRLRRAVQELPPQMRRCVLLRIDQELKYRDIATAMRLSIETVKSQIHQARQRLSAQLAGDPAGQLDDECEEP